jgi:hypothetical protein
VGVRSGFKVLVFMVTPHDAIDSSKFSLGNSWLSISSANLSVKISFILIFCQRLSSDTSSDSGSDNSRQRLSSDNNTNSNSGSGSDSSSDSG